MRKINLNHTGLINNTINKDLFIVIVYTYILQPGMGVWGMDIFLFKFDSSDKFSDSFLIEMVDFEAHFKYILMFS